MRPLTGTNIDFVTSVYRLMIKNQYFESAIYTYNQKRLLYADGTDDFVLYR